MLKQLTDLPMFLMMSADPDLKKYTLSNHQKKYLYSDICL